MIRPKLWRTPMLSVSITAAPVRIGSAGRKPLISVIVQAFCAGGLDYTDLFT